jgi:hypothetical protein
MTNREAFIITACQIAIELGWAPAVPEPICASWGGTPGDYRGNVVLLSLDPERPAELFLTVRPEPRDFDHRTARKMAAVASVLNRDFEPDVSIVFSGEPGEA